MGASQAVAAFFDTNVLVYCTDPRDPAKQARALELVEVSGRSGEGALSTQVLLELFNVLTRKQKLPAPVARSVVQAYAAWPVVDSDSRLVLGALDLAVRSDLSIFDAMVVEAAVRCGAQTLYSEDLQHGQRFASLTVVNPFI